MPTRGLRCATDAAARRWSRWACCPPEEIGRPHRQVMRPNLAPPVARGFCLGPCVQPSVCRPVKSAGLSADLRGSSPATSLMDVAGWQVPPSPQNFPLPAPTRLASRRPCALASARASERRSLRRSSLGPMTPTARFPALRSRNSSRACWPAWGWFSWRLKFQRTNRGGSASEPVASGDSATPRP